MRSAEIEAVNNSWELQQREACSWTVFLLNFPANKCHKHEEQVIMEVITFTDASLIEQVL
jgi:hypothetical protein